MPEKISITRDSGETINSNVVALFTIPDSGKQYIITTENAVDPHGLTVLHVSEIVEEHLKKIATDEEWSAIKTIMRAIISGNIASYQFLPKITTAKADIQYSRDISVSAAASQQIIDSYLAADISGASSTGGAEVEPLQDTNEITPGISEVVSAPAQPAPADELANVGNAVTNIPASAEISQPVPATPEASAEAQPAPALETPVVPAEQKDNEKNEVVEQQASAETPVSVVNVQTPVVAYVDPAFQQLLTSDYNQILMHVQSINNNINQIAAMPALNYQPSYSTSPNGTPNFNSNATVDDIIMGSTEVFNEGVKNLVATITEKIYRDLYQREAELTKREELLLEREKMVNEQLANLNASATTVPVQQPEVKEVAPAPAPVAEVPVAPAAPAPASASAPVAPQEQPVVNVVQAPVKVEAPAPRDNTVPAQQNTAPVAQPAPAPAQPVVSAPAPVVQAAQPAVPVAVETTPVVNVTPQPVKNVEVV